MVGECNLCSNSKTDQDGKLYYLRCYQSQTPSPGADWRTVYGMLVTADSVHSGSFARIHCLLLCLLFVLTVSCSCFRKMLQWGKLGIVASYERYIILK